MYIGWFSFCQREVKFQILGLGGGEGRGFLYKYFCRVSFGNGKKLNQVN